MKASTLRKAILNLAIQGKLVDQDPSDIPAQALLDDIKKEKEKLILERKLKKDKVDSVIYKEENHYYEKIGDKIKNIDDEIPFEIPENWSWCRLGEYSQKITDQIASGSFASLRKNVPSLKTKDYALMVKTADFSNGFTKNLTYTNKQGYDFLENSNLFGGELILSNIGSIGKCFIVPSLNCKMTLAPNSIMIRLTNNELRDFLYFFILSPQGFIELNNITSGTAMLKFNKTDLKTILLPIPPLEEQKRIVQEIEKYEPLIAQYDRLEIDKAKLDADILPRLKKSVLQYAIRGKLVDQDPSDIPAQALLDDIKKEKEKLIIERKLKKDKADSIIYKEENHYYEKIGDKIKNIDDEIPFEIPENWSWCRLNNILEIERGGSPRPIQEYLTDDKNGINWIKIGDTEKGGKYINSTKEKIKASGVSKSKFVRKGDFLLTNSMSFGRPYILNIDGCIHDGWIVLSNNHNILVVEFLYYLLSSNFVYWQFCNSVSGAVVKNLNISKVSLLLIPLPPLEEQKRIVHKIDEIFSQLSSIDTTLASL